MVKAADADDEDGERVVKAARELLRWKQHDLAVESGVGLATIRRFEAGIGVKANTRAALVAALEAAGVVFLQPAKRGRTQLRDGVALMARAQPKARTRRADAGVDDIETS